MKILVINGPNLNLLGLREREIYGNESYEDLLDYIRRTAAELATTKGGISCPTEKIRIISPSRPGSGPWRTGCSPGSGWIG